MMKSWIRLVLVSACLSVLASSMPARVMPQKHNRSNENTTGGRNNRNSSNENKTGGKNNRDDRNAGHNSCDVTILVKGQEQATGIAGAAVHIKSDYSGDTFDAKTNPRGMARISNVPRGRTLIQVTATGWQTSGNFYDLRNQAEPILVVLTPTQRRNPKEH